MVVVYLETIAFGLTIALLFAVSARLISHRRQTVWERDRRLELEAYCTLELTFQLNGDQRKRMERVKRVARLVTERSIFARCALFLPDQKEQLVYAGSSGMDDILLEALGAWSAHCLQQETSSTSYRHAQQTKDQQTNEQQTNEQQTNEQQTKDQQTKDQQTKDQRKSFSVSLQFEETVNGVFPQDCHTAVLIPVRLQRGKLVGMLAVCGSRAHRLDSMQNQEALVPLELLSAKLARTMERSMLMDRLIQVERLAGAAHLTAGVAEALAEPLLAIQDRSELIARTTFEPRIREHAQAITLEAEQIGTTLDTLRDAWKPREEAPQRVPNGQMQ